MSEKNRRSFRLAGYDYASPGAYFITICTKNKDYLFGEIMNRRMVLNSYGKIVHNEWIKTGHIRNNILLDEFIIMPNHVHGIITITDNVGARRAVPLPKQYNNVEQFGKPTTNTIPTIIRSFKSAVTNHINKFRNNPGRPIWQRNYYEHIIRTEHSLNKIREYIRYNALNWHTDILRHS